MKSVRTIVIILPLLAAISPGFSQQDPAVRLPDGVRAVWDISKAYREATLTRERICLNGLWRWQPAEAKSEHLPNGSWGYFKVPGSWPGLTDYMQKDSQTVLAHPDWNTRRLGTIDAAWYQRELTIPHEWAGRRIAVRVDYLNSYALVFVDGRKAGEIHFPAGELDITSACQPGTTHVLSMLVVALPLKGVMLSYTDSASAREVKGTVRRRGLCGDVYLVSQPGGARITATTADTSVRQRQITFGAALEDLGEHVRYTLRARIVPEGGAPSEFTSPAFQRNELKAGRVAFTVPWMPDKLWDIHTSQNTQALELALLEPSGRAVDVHWTARFGFREFWIEGRDFFLNGSRIHLSAVPLDNAQIGAALCTYEAARESLERLKGIGINFVYTHNYDCEPGSHLGFEQILTAADDVGMLVALTQPHFSHYDWKAPDADERNGYVQHAAFYTRVAQHHPSVVMYSMSHNATGYEEDMNPEMIDGLHEPRDNWSARNAKVALRAEAIVKRLDPGRIVYHHASGNLGSMHPINFYPNFVPIQELSDWFGHWAAQGVKPVFLCEYGAPFTWDWTMYRGWYKGQREFGGAKVPWEFCLAEWNAQLFGDRAYAISEPEKANLRWEAKQFRAGNLWHRWDYPNEVGSPRFEERYPLFASYLTDNWRAFRTWGVSAISPWEYGHFWTLREGVDRRRQNLNVNWETLQRPGFSPDYVEQRYERMDLAFERSDWRVTPAAEALLRNNQPLLAWLGGKPDRFTSKDHVFFPGETVEKQLIVINDSRQTVTCDGEWSFALPTTVTGRRTWLVNVGEQQPVPLRFSLPKALASGRYRLDARVRFSNGETQTDAFTVDVLARPRPPQIHGRIALFDPRGQTRELLNRMAVRFEVVQPASDLSGFDTLIVGKAALTISNAAPDIMRVRDGLKVLVFEQTAEALEKRFGFRVAEYGLRQVLARVPDHAALAGLTPEHWRDWRGEATLLPARLDYTLRPRYGPTVRWCDIPVPRLWRCGNQGNVASVLIEKPARGDFLPILDGGYGLQYSPLMEYREGRGLILFCQIDVTGRTEADPVADTFAGNILQYMSAWKPSPARTAIYAGDAAGKLHLESAGIPVASYDETPLSPGQVLIVGPGQAGWMSSHRTAIADWLKTGGKVLALGIDQESVDALPPMGITITRGEYISAYFEPHGQSSALRGIGPADVHNRDPREVPLIRSVTTGSGHGVLGIAVNGSVVFCQLVPWLFGPDTQPNLKRTHRRLSFVVTRLLSNLGVTGSTPILARFHTAVDVAGSEKRWLNGLYLDQPEEWDDPYRFFRW